MEHLVEHTFNITENLSIHYMQTDRIANLFVNNKEKNLLTKSAEEMTFKGFLNLIAFFSQTDNYTVDYNGIIIYRDLVYLNEHLYFVLEDTPEYFDEEFDEILKDYDEEMQVTLYYQTGEQMPDLEIASYDLNDYIIELFKEVQDFNTNQDYYKSKLLAEFQLNQQPQFQDTMER